MKLEVLNRSENSEIQKEIIYKIKELINFKNIEPGEKLPSERMLSEKFNVSRGNLREAIQKLEFYGLVKSIPQSGTFLANVGITATNGMIDDLLRLEDPEFKSLVETRILLELKTVRLAALRRTENDLLDLKSALEAYENKVINGQDAVQEDLLFHLAVAKASGNSTMINFMLIITPEIILNFEKHHVCDKGLSQQAIKEHQAIYNAIENGNPKVAKQTMKEHFSELYKYCYNIK